MLFLLDERLGIEREQLTEFVEELCRRMQADRGLKIRLVQRLSTKEPSKFTVHHDVDVGIDQSWNVGNVRAKRKHHVDFRPDAGDQTRQLGQIGWHVEHAVGRANDVHARRRPFGPLLFARHLLSALHAVLRPEPVQGAVRALPLILVDRPREEALNVGSLRRHAAADHFGN